MAETLSACRACRAPDPYLFLPMGNHPPANMFVRPEDADKAQPAFPLNSQACLNCGLIQVADQIPEDFFRHYLYVPSAATTMHGHFDALAERLVAEADGGLIVDIGCNDGLLLMKCNDRGAKTLGIDPAANLAETANERGVEVHVAYFGPQTARDVLDRNGRASVIVTTNTFNHIGDLHDFMAGVDILLAEDGTFVIEVPRADKLLEYNAFDTIYQEHVSEFSLLSIQKLAEFFDMTVGDVVKMDVHAGSMRVFVKRNGAKKTEAVTALLAEEKAAGVLSAEAYDALAERVQDIRAELLKILEDAKAQGLKLAGYGAPAKGNTLLNFFGIGPDLLPFLVDRSALKQGLLSPGMKIPVRGVEAVEEEGVDVLLVLAWNFLDEIRAQQEGFLSRGGRLLAPLPTPRFVGSARTER